MGQKSETKKGGKLYREEDCVSIFQSQRLHSHSLRPRQKNNQTPRGFIRPHAKDNTFGIWSAAHGGWLGWLGTSTRGLQEDRQALSQYV